ncbi:hypothetical protein BH20BAC1_BH20BAC1_05490 [soil metagenome]
MRHLKLTAAFFALFLIFLTGCKKDPGMISRDAPIESPDDIAGVKKSSQLTPAFRQKLMDLSKKLPAGSRESLVANVKGLIKTHPEYRNMVNNALKLVATPCDPDTPLFLWLDGELADWDGLVIFYAVITGMLDFPTYDALLFENSSAGQYFGKDGEYTKPLVKTFKDLKRFWNIQTDDLVMVAMHGSMLRDRDRVIRIDMILYGDDQATAEFWADLILELLDEVPQYRNGDHPIFTFNAFAQPSFFFPPVGVIPPKIVMGDGIMEGYTALGYGDIAPQAILAHEFGHHIQFQLDLFTDVSSPEATRRTELMADAFAAYYLSHARGATMQWKRVKQFLQVFFNIGDCGFTSNGHHGTPTQRMAAAEWAYKLADNAQKQGHILTAQQFVALFEAALPGFVAP